MAWLFGFQGVITRHKGKVAGLGRKGHPDIGSHLFMHQSMFP